MSHATSTTTPWTSEADRLASFAAALDDIHRRTKAQIGESDLRYIRRVDGVSRAAEFLGRTLIAVSPGPLLFSAGVVSLWVYKQLQATEIGHPVLHGAYNRIEGAGKFHSAKHEWQTPIDEPSWLRGHNGRHHGLTNVAGHDADIHFGPVRLTADTPHQFVHYFQIPFTFVFLLPLFTLGMNIHFTGLADVWNSSNKDHLDFLEDRSPESIKDAYVRFGRKWLRYHGKEYLLWPTLATAAFGLAFGPMVFAKSLAGNWLSERMRDVYSGLTIICGHVGEDTAHYPEGTMPKSKGERYAMQVEATNNYSVPWLVSVFCGALDKQIEHHLFPSLPTNRLREIAPEVRAVCEAHGVAYRETSWPRAVWGAIKQIARLSRKLPHERGEQHDTTTPPMTAEAVQ